MRRSLDSILKQFRDTGSVTMLVAEDVEVLVRGIEATRGAYDLMKHRVEVLDKENADLKRQALEDAKTIRTLNGTIQDLDHREDPGDYA